MKETEVLIITTYKSNIVYSLSTNKPVNRYAFRGYHYITAIIAFALLGILYNLCFNIGYTISLINRAFLRHIMPNVKIKQMLILIIVKGIGNRKHNASKYIRLKIYLLGKNGTAVIKRELYIVDNLSTKVLIGINIIKPEGITIDLGKDIIKVSTCDDMEIPINIITKGPYINATVFSSKRITIPAYTNIVVLVTGPKKRLCLPDNRDLIFKPKTLDTLSVYAYIVDYNISKVFIRNDTDRLITLLRYQKLGNITDYNASI